VVSETVIEVGRRSEDEELPVDIVELELLTQLLEGKRGGGAEVQLGCSRPLHSPPCRLLSP
jgi:hypothetical protein